MAKKNFANAKLSRSQEGKKFELAKVNQNLKEAQKRVKDIKLKFRGGATRKRETGSYFSGSKKKKKINLWR